MAERERGRGVWYNGEWRNPLACVPVNAWDRYVKKETWREHLPRNEGLPASPPVTPQTPTSANILNRRPALFRNEGSSRFSGLFGYHYDAVRIFGARHLRAGDLQNTAVAEFDCNCDNNKLGHYSGAMFDFQERDWRKGFLIDGSVTNLGQQPKLMKSLGLSSLENWGVVHSLAMDHKYGLPDSPIALNDALLKKRDEARFENDFVSLMLIILTF